MIYEDFKRLFPVFVEEAQELAEALQQFLDKKEDWKRSDIGRIYEECQDVAMVLVSIFHTTRVLKGDINDL